MHVLCLMNRSDKEIKNLKYNIKKNVLLNLIIKISIYNSLTLTIIISLMLHLYHVKLFDYFKIYIPPSI